MNNNIYNPENIEAYLGNKLSLSDKLRFENEITKDPLLQSEVTLQKDIVESLKNHRKAQLKHRLNNIEVSMSPGYFEIGAKVAASLVVSGLIGFGIYSYFGSNSNEVVATKANTTLANTEAMEIITPSNSSSIINTMTKASTEIQNEAPIQNNQPASTNVTATSNNTVAANNNKASNRKQTENISARTNPGIDENFGNNDFQAEGNISVPKGQIAQTTDNKSSVNVSIDAYTDKKFHYKYFSNKLFLYGNFDSTTYEILELNTYNNKQVYLYYDNKYYKLNANQLDVAPLVQITDSKTISDLKKLNK